MGVWTGVLVVGAASLAFRLVPLLVVERSGMRARTADGFRHAGAGAVTALVVLGLLGAVRSGSGPAVAAAIVLGAVVAWHGHSMARVVLVGGCCYLAVTALTGGF